MASKRHAGNSTPFSFGPKDMQVIQSLSALAISAAATVQATQTEPPVWWADMNIEDPFCRSDVPYSSLSSKKLFSSKRECCEKMLPWLPLEQCIGVEMAEASSALSAPARPITIAAADNVDCTYPSITRTQCLAAPNCVRARRKTDNGLWISYCAFKEDTASLASYRYTPMQLSSIESAGTTPVFLTTLPSHAPKYDVSSESTPNPSTLSSLEPTSSPYVIFEEDEPQLYCASSSEELEATCSTAPRCDKGPCPKGMFCFPYECIVVHSASFDVTSESSSKSPISPILSEPLSPVSSSKSPSTSPAAYKMFPSQSTISTTEKLGAGACLCDPDTSLCRKKEDSYLSHGSSDLHICIYSTPNESELLEIVMLVFFVEGDEVPHLIVEGSGVMFDGTSIVDVDPQTKMIKLGSEQFFAGVPASGFINFGGFATVIDTTKEVHAPLAADFSLDLEVVESMHSTNQPSLRPTNSPTSYLTTFSPTVHPTNEPSLRPTNSPTLHPTTSQPTEQAIPELELILKATADSTVSHRRPDETFGNLQAIAINGGSFNSDSDRFDSLIKFDLSMLDPSYSITSASLKMFSVNSCSGESGVYRTEDDAWDEDTVTWKSAPAATGIRIAAIPAMTTKTWQDLDITLALSAWQTGYHAADDSLSLRIMSSSDAWCMFASSQSGEMTRARIVIKYTKDEGSFSMSQMSGVYDSYDLVLGTSAAYDPEKSPSQGPTPADDIEDEAFSDLTILIASADASISNIRRSKNFGVQNMLVVDGGYGFELIRGSSEDSEQFDALIQFDTSSIKGVDVKSAMLRMHVSSGCSFGGDVYATTGHSDWVQETVTWDDAPQAVGSSIGSFSSVSAGQWYSVDLNTDSDIFLTDQLTLRIVSTEDSRCMYSSLDRGDETAPRLVVRIQQTAQNMVHSTTDNTNISAPLQPTQELIPVSGNFILLVATDDATIDATAVESNLGNSEHLTVDYNERTREIHDVVIRFDLGQMHGGALPRSALLTMFTEGQCLNAGTFMTTEGGGEWNESNISWSSAPNYSNRNSYAGGKMIGTFGAVNAERWYGFSVIEALTEAVLSRKSAVTFRLTSGNMQSCSYSSLQSGRPPKLLVAF